MTLPNSDSLKEKFPQDNPSHEERLENLKSYLKLACKSVAKANRKSHQRNKRYYDRKAKPRQFTVNELVYLHNPATKPGLTRKFSKSWQGPYKVTKKLSDLNYEIIDQYGKKHIVHVNRLKRTYSSEQWMPKSERKPARKLQRNRTQNYSESEDNGYQVRPFPLVSTEYLTGRSEPETPAPHVPSPPHITPPSLDTPASERRNPTYRPPNTPLSRRELVTTRVEPPVTRSRAKLMSQDTELPNED